MFPRPEVARVNDEGIYEIDLMGVPKPTSEGTWTVTTLCIPEDYGLPIVPPYRCSGI